MKIDRPTLDGEIEQVAIEDAKILKLTEADMLDRLMGRYSERHGNGLRYVRAKHVRSHAGFDARRTADFVAMDLWPSKGLCLHGHEVKVSRSDWLSELKKPDKAMEFIPWMDYWWLVVSDASIVRPGELPNDWGLMAASAGRLRVVTAAKRNHHVQEMPRMRFAALVRAVAKTEAAA